MNHLKGIRKQLVDAMTVAVENNGGELHGTEEFLLYKIFRTANPVGNSDLDAAFREVVNRMGLEFLTAGARDIEYLVGPDGTINLVHRGYCYE